MSRPLEVLLYHMGAFTASDVEWTANFARSVLRHSRNPDWEPSSKQLRVMQRLVDDLFQENETEVLDDEEIES